MRAVLILGSFLLTTTAAQAQDIGIAACDNLVKVYESCAIARSPAATQPQMKSALDQMRTNWKAVAGTPDGKAKLEPVCKQTADQMKQQLASLNCPW